jgi:hypothetical protein
VKYLATFEEDNDLLPLYADIGECGFPEGGFCGFEIYFSARDGGEALKGEQPHTVLGREE